MVACPSLPLFARSTCQDASPWAINSAGFHQICLLYGDIGLLYGLPKRFVAGAIVYGDTDKCVEGAEVTLEGEVGGKAVRRTVRADNYGDFEFEGLPPDQTYKVTVAAEEYEPRQLTARTNIDTYLGDIVIRPVKQVPGVQGGR